ncbi:MAG: rhombotarget lipoprotein [Woeseiaceae bacterium]|nr:rhombotarget lipoprotein [Woeseiaceae bacterium]
MKRSIFVLALLGLVLSASGCTALFGLGTETRRGVSSSLVDYLYPQGEVPPDHSATIPSLNLPLRVGLAFVPTYSYNDFTEAKKIELLETVKAAFVQYDYIEHIEVIPDTYLRSSKGIGGMQQVARLYGVDVMALVSYDQVTVTEDNKAALLYWTIVGAYLIEGTNNEVQTFVDTAVFDVNTAKLLFRAPGTNTAADRSTAIDSDMTVRRQSEASFASAVTAMTGNLQQELARFEERVEQDAQVANVQWKQGYGGGGAVDGWLLLALALFAVAGIGLQGGRREV